MTFVESLTEREGKSTDSTSDWTIFIEFEVELCSEKMESRVGQTSSMSQSPVAGMFFWRRVEWSGVR